ncbi:protein GAMETE EXPRESSED 2-like [Dorcoceras hygrometricum]|uniref:Protein GAMETE EXPRESSED 2-like n=1 Tax=Dorcoceras hygrometricum TaxID=472368 RepID=A0A2Z7BG72_9LAMI|nr:protein GAMETE EXPRESSED 2-like [Dorcoceras hygrometricum]
MPLFAFSWVNNSGMFVAGDAAEIRVIVLGKYDSGKYEFPFNPNITVNDRIGNSSYISGVSLDFGGEVEDWKICFTPIMVGSFYVLITDHHFRVLDSSLHFGVTPGRMYPASGILSWKDGVDRFIAGTVAEVFVLPKDAFGNNVSSSSEGPVLFDFTLFALTTSGLPADVLNVTNKGWNQQGYISIEFVAATAGSLLLHVEVEKQALEGSPLAFIVDPGILDIPSCVAKWNVETNLFQLFSKMEAFIHQYDLYANLVSGLYEFDIEVMEKGTNLSMPIADMRFKEIEPGIQSFSFSLEEPGNFTLVISDKEHTTLIFNTPYDFAVYIGYCDGMNSIVNGSGLNDSVAGDTAKFSVFLKDAYLYPSPVEVESLQVRIVHEFDSQILHPIILIREIANGSMSSGRPNHGDFELMQFSGNRSPKAIAFDVIYRPEKSGIYGISVFCGNIQLNGGHQFTKEVSAAAVNMSLSEVVKCSTKVPKMVDNEIVVRLKDSYYNHVLSEQARLKLEIVSNDESSVVTWNFSDNKDGTYTAGYQAKEVGTYEICASYDGEHFMACPFRVNVYNSEYFPKVYDDTVSVWEDESIAFYVLENDYFAGGHASIFEYTKPHHGSLMLYGYLFRYTPYKRFHGNDSFLYTIADVNGNLASGAVDIFVLCVPPQLVSIPMNLQATEDVVSPTFGGFPGIEIIYSDLSENITVTLSAQNGIVLLSPMLMQFQPGFHEFSIRREIGNANGITLIGCLDSINFALKSIKYFGNKNFYGSDAIRISSTNRNGENTIDVPLYVQPINDPPVINVPSYIILDEKSDGVLIFGGQNAKMDFVTDPDIVYFPGNRSHFLLLSSVEVSSGFLSTSLPAELIGSTEIKLKSSHQWQPLLTFVTISKHFLVKAKAIRYRGSVEELNNIMEQLMFHVCKHGAVLTVTVTDLGNHGCYPNCNEMLTSSLFVQANVNLIRKRPMSSFAAHAFGAVIVFESISVLCLGLMLLFFICKCAVILLQEKKRQKAQQIELSNIQDSSTQALAVGLSENEKLSMKSSADLSVIKRRSPAFES